MYKYLILPVVSIVLLGTMETASAQTYYQGSYTSCVNLSRDLSKGMRGSDVTDLQRFLVAQNYPGGGSWMITGYFGSATEAAVKNYQTQKGLLSVGIVGSQTRAAIQADTCGSSYNYGYNYSFNYNPSYTYTTPTYTTPYYNYSYPYNYYNYTYPTYPTGSINLYSLTPNSGGVGTTVTVYGSGFSTDSNTVHFGRGIIANLRSIDGTSLSFTVPTQLTGYGTEQVQLTTYQVSVTNKYGQTSGNLPFTVTSLASQTQTPSIVNVSGPNTINTNTQGTWSVQVNAPQGSYLSTSVTWATQPTRVSSFTTVCRH